MNTYMTYLVFIIRRQRMEVEAEETITFEHGNIYSFIIYTCTTSFDHQILLWRCAFWRNFIISFLFRQASGETYVPPCSPPYGRHWLIICIIMHYYHNYLIIILRGNKHQEPIDGNIKHSYTRILCYFIMGSPH